MVLMTGAFAGARQAVTIHNGTGRTIAIRQSCGLRPGALWRPAPGSHAWLEPGDLATFSIPGSGREGLAAELTIRRLTSAHPLHVEGLEILAMGPDLAPVPPEAPWIPYPDFHPIGDEPPPDPEGPETGPIPVIPAPS
jgi:hypothetical protein